MPSWIPFKLEPPSPLAPIPWASELTLGFLLLAFVVGKFIVPMLADMMQVRARSIAEASDQVEATLRDVETMRNDYRQRLENIEDETEQRMAQGVEEAQALRAQILAESEVLARDIVERGNSEIERERAKISIQLHREFVDDVIGAAAFAMRQSVDDRLQERLVADFVSRVRTES
jgi:F-type H+-transporting ATPase subunit b